MKLALLSSNKIRHIFFAQVLSRFHDLSLVVTEEKGIEDQLSGENEEDTNLLLDHFDSLEKEQKAYFGDLKSFPETVSEIVNVKRGNINDSSIANRIKKHNIEGIAVFGTGILKEIIFECCPGKVINAHQGLSPYYRGSGTNFWPFVNMELQYVGVTLHYIDAGIDTGGIICHGRPEIEKGDSAHRVGCKTVEVSANLMSDIFTDLEDGKEFFEIQQWYKGKFYQRKDFNAAAIREARANVKNGMVDRYVDMVKKGVPPKIQLVRIA